MKTALNLRMSPPVSLVRNRRFMVLALLVSPMVWSTGHCQAQPDRLPYPETEFNDLRRKFGVRNASTVEQANALNDLLRDREMTPQQCARALEEHVAWLWGEMHTALDKAKLPEGSRHQALRQKMMAYVEIRRQSMLLRAQAVRTGDRKLARQSDELAERANVQGKAMRLAGVQEPLTFPKP